MYEAAKLRDEVAQPEREQVPALKGDMPLDYGSFRQRIGYSKSINITWHFLAHIPKMHPKNNVFVVWCSGDSALFAMIPIVSICIPQGKVESTGSLKI